MSTTKVQSKAQQAARKAWDKAKGPLKDAANAAGKAAAKSILKAIISSNGIEWYVKYGPVTPASNKNRPMDPVFNLSITDNPAIGAVPKYIDINVSWGNFFETRSFDLITQKAMQALRKELRSNLPYGMNELRRYLANSVSIGILAKQFERDVHWNLYSSQYFRKFNEAWRYTANPEYIGVNGAQELYYHTFLSEEEWPKTVTLYDQIAFQSGTNIKLPPALYDFIDHYFNKVFVTRPDVTNAQILRLRVNQLPLVDKDGSLTFIDVSNTSAADLFALISDHVNNSAIIIADLERSNQLKSLHMDAYDSNVYNLIYDETFLQAIENGYTSTSAVSANGYVRLDEKFSSADPLTQFLFMGGLQDYIEGSPEAYFPAFTINSMTVKCYSVPELRWPMGLLSRDSTSYIPYITTNPNEGYFYVEEPTYFGINVSTDINSVCNSNVTITYNTMREQALIVGGNMSTYSAVLDTIALKVPTGTMTKKYDSTNSTILNLVSGTPMVFGGWIATRIAHYPTCDVFVTRSFDVGNPLYGKYTVSPYGGARIVCVDSATTKLYNKEAIVILAASGLSNDEAIDQLNTTGTAEPGHIWEPSSTVIRGGVAIPSSNIAMNDNRDGILFRAVNATTQLDEGNSAVILDEASVGSDTWELMETDTDWNSRFVVPQGLSYPSGVYATLEYRTPVNTDLENVLTIDYKHVGLASYVADNVDIHIPFVSTNTFTATMVTNSEATSTPSSIVVQQVKSNPVLIKETEKPYFYNILDLEPTLYRMFTSLFSMEGSDRISDRPKGRGK